MKLLTLAILLFSLKGFAGPQLPQDFSQLEGAFKGVGLSSKKSAYLLVYRVLENNQSSCRFNIFLISQNKAGGQVLEAECIGATALAVLGIGTTSNSKYLEAKLPPAGILEERFDAKHGRYLHLGRQKNTSFLPSPLAEDYAFTSDSDDIRVYTGAPLGLFNSNSNSVSSTNGNQGTLNLVTQLPSLGLTGKFVGVSELAGVTILREQKLDNSLYQYSEGEISGMLVTIVSGKRVMVVVGKISDGRPQSIVFLPLTKN